MATDTEREVAMQDGNGDDQQLADQDALDLAQPRQVAMTQRGRDAVQTYLGDLRQARSIAQAPPSYGELIDRLWRNPEVLANSMLLKVLVKLYAIPAIVIVSILWFLIVAQMHPGRALAVDGLIGLGIWLWFFS